VVFLFYKRFADQKAGSTRSNPGPYLLIWQNSIGFFAPQFGKMGLTIRTHMGHNDTTLFGERQKAL